MACTVSALMHHFVKFKLGEPAWKADSDMFGRFKLARDRHV